ncbi:MAG: hypothetical protein NVSMB59_15420 [Vulcanimicrobiaceae bacterium]
MTTNGGFAKTLKNVTQAGSAVTSNLGKPGDILEYDLSFTNTSGASLANVVVGDGVPAQTTFVAASCGPLPAGVTACSVASPAVGSMGTVTYTYAGTLANGAVATFTMQVRIN